MKPFVYSCFSLLAGVATAIHVVWIGAIVALLLAVNRVSKAPLVYLLCFGAGYLIQQASVSHVQPLHGDTVRIVAAVKLTPERYTYKGEIGTVGALIYTDKPLAIGALCQVEKARRLTSLSNEPFRYADYWHERGVDWTVEVESCRVRDVTFIERVAQWRQQLVLSWQAVYNSDGGELVIALLFGADDDFSASYETAVQQLGIAHLIAISGSHIAFFAALYSWWLKHLLVPREWIIASLLILLPLYAIIAGATPAVLRAIVFAFVLAVAYVMKRRMQAFPLLVGACTVLVVWQPYYITDIGFLLSAVVSTALLLSWEGALQWSNARRYVYYIFVAQWSALPLVLYAFFQWGVMSVLANVVLIPVYSFVALPLALIAFILHIVNMSAAFVVQLFDLLVVLTVFLHEYSPSSWLFGRPPLWLLIVFSISFYWLMMRVTKRKIIINGVLLLSLALSSSLNPFVQLAMVDVGQGDCFVAIAPFKRYVLVVDTGGKLPFFTKQIGAPLSERTLLPFLQMKGIDVIDTLVLTHGDYDHAGEALHVLQKVRVKQVVLNRGGDVALEQQIIALARRNGTIVTRATVGQQFDDWRVLAARDGGEENDESIVLYGYRTLLLGDLPSTGEEELVRRYPTLHVERLKVAHHGSKTSTSATLLQSYRPLEAWISVGRQNRYGHPNEAVMARLRDRAITVYRTDEGGMREVVFWP